MTVTIGNVGDRSQTPVNHNQSWPEYKQSQLYHREDTPKAVAGLQ